MTDCKYKGKLCKRRETDNSVMPTDITTGASYEEELRHHNDRVESEYCSQEGKGCPQCDALDSYFSKEEQRIERKQKVIKELSDMQRTDLECMKIVLDYQTALMELRPFSFLSRLFK